MGVVSKMGIVESFYLKIERRLWQTNVKVFLHFLGSAAAYERKEYEAFFSWFQR